MDKVGEILLFISLIADQASLLAPKAVTEAAANNNAGGSNFSALADEIQKRAGMRQRLPEVLPAF